MNDFSELESELKKLRPAAVSPQLAQRIEELLIADQVQTAGFLAQRGARTSLWWWFGAVLSGLAASLVIGLIYFENSPLPQNLATTQSAAESGFQPVGLTQVVYSGRDEGLVFPPNDSGPRRRVRYETRETMRWRNPQTGASVRLSYPAEQVVLRPVSFQ